MKKVLNVGGNSKKIALPAHFAGFEHLLLDIDPTCMPDVLCDARTLSTQAARSFDAVYCSHNLEHYYRHEVPKVLAGFLHVLKDDGFAQIIVPDISEVMRLVVENKIDIESPLYQSASGPILVHDVLYGYGPEIERSGNDFYAHKTGFTNKYLMRAIQAAGFAKCYTQRQNLEINAIAFKSPPDQAARAMFGIP